MEDAWWTLCMDIFFFFQAEDGIRDGHVTGVQTCALPIYGPNRTAPPAENQPAVDERDAEIGRASCREKSVDLGGRRIIKKKKKKKNEIDKLNRNITKDNIKIYSIDM